LSLRPWHVVSIMLTALSVGAACEIGAVLSVLMLVFVVRGRRPAFGWTFAAALLMVGAHRVYWIWLAPVNAQVATMTPPAGRRA